MDERIGATFHYVRAIKKYIRYNKPIQNKLKDSETYPFMRYLNERVTTIVDATMCSKVSHLELAWGIGSSREIPRFNKWPCAKGTCEECGVKILNLGECTYFTTNNDEIKVLEWIEAKRQGKKIEHKYSTRIRKSEVTCL